MKEQLSIKNGEWVAVVRPEDPQKAITATLELAAKRDTMPKAEFDQAFNELLWLQPYRFQGYLTVHGKIADRTGKVLEYECKAGDSFVNAADLLKCCEPQEVH